MKAAEPSFSVSDFLTGARSAYEMILMGFETGEIDRIRPFLSAEIEASFGAAIDSRAQQGLTVQATFAGLRELTLQDASFNTTTRTAEISVRFIADLTSVVRDKSGTVIEGSPTVLKRQRDVWTFARKMGVDDPN